MKKLIFFTCMILTASLFSQLRIPDRNFGGFGNNEGLKEFRWDDATIPPYQGVKSISFSQEQLKIDIESNPKGVQNYGNLLRFYIDPLSTPVESWSTEDFHMRAEIRCVPWEVDHPLGTEEWFGWSYTFGKGYKIDPGSDFTIFQVYPSSLGNDYSPDIALAISRFDNNGQGIEAGTLAIVNAANRQGTEPNTFNDYVDLGIIPKAGETLNIVIRIVWGDDATGELKLWINGNVAYDQQVRTVQEPSIYGGCAKWGIYKSPWRKSSKVFESLNNGIVSVETFMGPLRIVTRRPSNPEIGTDAYELVRPD